jgi:hypothetical protein
MTASGPDLTPVKVTVRQADDGDLGYVIDTFGKSLRSEYPDVRTRDFAEWIRAHLKRLLEGENAWLIIAHPPTEPVVIWGWALGSADRLHFAYVRESHRRGKILLSMLHAIDGKIEGLRVSHLTEDGRALKRRFEWRYVPVP